jgi:hypothetical protein
MKILLPTAIVFLSLLPCPALIQNTQGEEHPFDFQNVSESSGLSPQVKGIHGHAAGWGDADGDGWAELYVGTFHTEGPPNLLLKNTEGKFTLAEQPAVEISSRPTGVLFVDLDNDGDLDLYVSSMPAAADSKLAARVGHPLRGCSLFANDGKGKFKDVSKVNDACPVAFGGRSAAAIDFNGDGLLDLLVGEDPLPGYNGSETKSSRLFQNLGDLKFKDVSRDAGLPAGIPGLGVAAADVNGDGWPDFFLAGTNGSNRLFLNDGKGKFGECPGSAETFAWPTAKGDNMVCGVTISDVNGDALPDIVLGQHFEKPWQQPVVNRLYLHRGNKEGVPRFEDVTEKAGLTPVPMKSPHVEMQDFDNDGRPDLFASMVMFSGDKVHPLIFHNDKTIDGIPKFSQTAIGVNDFPTAEDKAIGRTGTFFEKMLEDGKVIYTAPAPTCDYNRDGKLDIFLCSWWTEAPSLLLENQTTGGNWLDVAVTGTGGVNRMGVGSLVKVYEGGKLGDADALLGCREIAVGFGYASGQEAVAHFGLGDTELVDIEVVLPHGRGKLSRRGVKAGQRIVVSR